MLRVMVEIIESFGHAIRRNFSQLQDRKLWHIAPRYRNQLAPPAPKMAAGAVVWNNLSRARRAVLHADQPPTFAPRSINAHIASSIELIQITVTDDAVAAMIYMTTG